MIGTRVSHYTILEKLGAGGMGVVYKAEDTRLKRFVALKFLPPDLTRDEEAKERFLNEAQAASTLDHPNICNIHEIGETEDGRLFIVMAYYDGETLKQKLASGRLPLAEALDLAGQIAQGLAEAHAHGIIHRDIKPANIMITSEGVAKILDFGLAKLAGQAHVTRLGATLGTPKYMSPEQARGEAIDQRTDLWSLGAVLYEALAGRPAFNGEYEQSVIYSILNEEPQPLTGLRAELPPALDRILRKALAKHPAERYQHISELLADLQRMEAGAPVGVPTRRFRLTAPLRWGIVGLALLGGALWLLVQPGAEVAQTRKSIAVLPFVPITKSEEDRSFAAGIHNDVLTQVSKISEVKVIARTSVLRYQDSPKSIKEIARELDVRTVLEGSTRRSGNTIRVTAQLIDAKTEESLWADTYDRPYADIFAIQSDIAQKIAAALQARLGQEELRSIQAPPTRNLQAYEHYQKGKYFWSISYDWEGNLMAAERFAEACRLDSTFALAYAWQSIAYSVVYLTTPNLASKSAYDHKSKAALQRAAALAPDLPEVYLAKGNYLAYVKSDADGALREAEIANQKRPNDTWVLSFMSDLLSSKQDLAGALRLAERIYRLDPKGISGPFYAAWHSFSLGRFAEAERWADIMIANDPEGGAGYGAKISFLLRGFGAIDRAELVAQEAGILVTRDKDHLLGPECLLFAYKRDYARALATLAGSQQPSFYLLRALLLNLLNRPAEARANFDSARLAFGGVLNASPNNQTARLSLAIAYAGLGERVRAQQEMAQVDSLSRIGQGLEIAYFHILNGENEAALQYLEKCISRPREPSPAVLRRDPRLDALRGDARFQKIIARTEAARRT
ncbi:MAG: Serine/threonine-protein kinase PknD [bacterium]|nr:Serine/threonine-protein kinase PknD [bacterium]